MILDIGCGSKPRGMVNIDPNPFLKKLDIGRAPNFIIAVIEFLPLRKVFDKIILSHVLEHLNNPWNVLRALYDFTNFELEIIVPHRLWFKRYPDHKHYFNRKWFEYQIINKLKTNNYQIKIHYVFFPFKFFGIKYPKLIRVNIKKMS